MERSGLLEPLLEEGGDHEVNLSNSESDAKADSPADIERALQRPSIGNTNFMALTFRGNSYRGTTLTVELDDAGEEEEKNEGSKFVLEKLQGISHINKMQEKDNAVRPSNKSDVEASLVESGDTYTGESTSQPVVFVAEVISDLHTTIALSFVFLAMVSYITLEYVLWFMQKTISGEIPIFRENATADDIVCYPNKADATCKELPEVNISVAQASLLANTVVVSEGINATDWQDNGAKPGTPPFFANSLVGSFVVDPSVLEYSANSELQPVWNELNAVIWYQYDRHVALQVFREYKEHLIFTKMDGDWSSDIGNTPFTLDVKSYSCVRGGDGFCKSVGNWRRKEAVDIKPKSVRVKGNELHLEMGHSVSVDTDFFDYYAARVVVTGEKGGIISECIQKNTCIVTSEPRGVQLLTQETVWISFAYFVGYFAFYIWWLITVHKRRGSPKNWPREDVWLSIGGLGVLLETNLFRIGLDLSVIYSKSFTFCQQSYAAAEAISNFGQTLIFFTILCYIDSPRRRIASKLDFYGCKAFSCACFLACLLVINLYNYPQAVGTDQPGTTSELGRNGFATNPYLWDPHDRTVRKAGVIIWLSLLTMGFSYFIWKSIVGVRLLDKLPYGQTRSTQLSFRFFWFAAIGWLACEYSTLLISLIMILAQRTRADGVIVALSFTYEVNSESTIGSNIFVIIFFVVLQIFFLPLPLDNSFGDNKEYFHSEDEKERCPAECCVHEHPMILNKTLLFCICSNEAYMPFNNDEMSQMAPSNKTPGSDMVEDEKQSLVQPKTPENESSSRAVSSDRGLPDDIIATDTSTTDGSSVSQSSLSSKTVPGLWLAGEMSSEEDSTWMSGCRLVDRVYESGNIDIHDTRVLILRHEPSGDLIVSFRGTATLKMVKTDIMLDKIAVDLDKFLTKPALGQRVKSTGTRMVHNIQDDLASGKVGKFQLIDLLPKEDESLPPYLKGARKDPLSIHGVAWIHFGFWSSYNRVRCQLHEKIREELVARPGRLILTGHSLGGAQATLCAYDMCRWIVPTVKHDILYRFRDGRKRVEKLKVSCYTYGSPKVGGPFWAAAYNQVVPDTQRIVCDGDIITSGPFMGYLHVKTESIFDFTGSVRVDPNLMEKQITLKKRNKASSHFLSNYLSVIRKSFHPDFSEEELMNITRSHYHL
mmetsp:Transcript_28698/g.38216  ORF Transcript_28698/g.38216 Transcript_28698/m.38216 type:complete len:1162 (-) Transcript_28698:520-4005(-)